MIQDVRDVVLFGSVKGTVFTSSNSLLRVRSVISDKNNGELFEGHQDCGHIYWDTEDLDDSHELTK